MDFFVAYLSLICYTKSKYKGGEGMINGKRSVSALLKAANKEKEFKDSRGVKLTDGDIVLLHDTNYMGSQTMCIGKVHIVFDKSGLDESGTQLDFYRLEGNKMGYQANNTLLFKIDFDPVKFKSLTNKVHIATTTDAYTWGTRGVGRLAKELEQVWKAENHKSTTRGYPVQEYFGNDLKMGSLVLYKGNDMVIGEECGNWSYGIVVSNTQVLTEYLKVTTIHQAFALSELTESEQTMYKSLSEYYTRSIQSNTRKKNKGSLSYSVGDVISSGNSLYMYLGKIGITSKRTKRSNYRILYKIDESAAYWVVLNNARKQVNVGQMMNMLKNDQDSIVNTLTGAFNRYKTQSVELDIDDSFYTIYTAICDFGLLTQPILNNGVSVGRLSLNKNYILPVYGATNQVKLFDLQLSLLDA